MKTDPWKYHHEFNAMPLTIADAVRVNGVVSLDDECVPVSINPASLYLSAHFLARAEKARLLCDLGKAILERRRSAVAPLEYRIWTLDKFVQHGITASSPCTQTNALTIRTRRKPLRVTRRNVREYLRALRENSMPHEIDCQFRFLVGDYADRLVLYVTEDLHFFKLSICSEIKFQSMPYPYLDYLCQDALGGNQEFLKNAE